MDYDIILKQLEVLKTDVIDAVSRLTEYIEQYKPKPFVCKKCLLCKEREPSGGMERYCGLCSPCKRKKKEENSLPDIKYVCRNCYKEGERKELEENRGFCSTCCQFVCRGCGKPDEVSNLDVNGRWCIKCIMKD